MDRGDLTRDADGQVVIGEGLIDFDPDDTLLAQFLQSHAHNRVLYEFPRDVRDKMGEVIFEGAESLLSSIVDDFYKALALWAEMMQHASVKLPCHQVILRALKRRMAGASRIAPLTVFEGRAGIGVVLREAVMR